tara:strand:- start:77 stop:508 length:432 start_codon:yes stop_codon:yes gene_type:complete
MKKRNFKIASWFIREELEHKVTISYDNESERSYDLLKIMLAKYWKIDNRRSFNNIEVTEEEYQTWYVYFLEYYIDEQSIFVNSKEEKESKRLLKAMKKFFGNPNFDMDHRAGSKLRFVRSMVKYMGTEKAEKVAEGLKDQCLN